jgi:hypothetical protein
MRQLRHLPEVLTMSWTKRQIAEKAYGELALAGFVFDISPEEMQAAIVELDMLMASWEAIDINIGYAFGLTPDAADPDQDSALPLVAMSAVVKTLAVNIAASKGKQLAPSTKAATRAAYNALLSWVGKRQVEQQRSRQLPVGAGNRRRRSLFTSST